MFDIYIHIFVKKVLGEGEALSIWLSKSMEIHQNGFFLYQLLIEIIRLCDFVTLQKIFTLFQEIIIHFLKLNKTGIYWDIVDILMTQNGMYMHFLGVHVANLYEMFNPLQDGGGGGGKKPLPYQFFPCTSYKCNFNPFATLV